MSSLRILLLAFLLVFALSPYITWRFQHAQNLAFEHEEKLAVAAGGEIYGDCSGVSFILPLLIAAHAIVFFFWTLVAAVVAKNVGYNATLIQTFLIGFLGVAPSILLMLTMVGRT